MTELGRSRHLLLVGSIEPCTLLHNTLTRSDFGRMTRHSEVSRELERSRRIAPGCPVWMGMPISPGCYWAERHWAGSSTPRFRSQKFETCPDWGATFAIEATGAVSESARAGPW